MLWQLAERGRARVAICQTSLVAGRHLDQWRLVAGSCRRQCWVSSRRLRQSGPFCRACCRCVGLRRGRGRPDHDGCRPRRCRRHAELRAPGSDTCGVHEACCAGAPTAQQSKQPLSTCCVRCQACAGHARGAGRSSFQGIRQTNPAGGAVALLPPDLPSVTETACIVAVAACYSAHPSPSSPVFRQKA